MYPQLQENYKVQEAWLAKLGHWNEALAKYDERLAKNPRDGEATAGKLKCLDALGRWEEVGTCTWLSYFSDFVEVTVASAAGGSFSLSFSFFSLLFFSFHLFSSLFFFTIFKFIFRDSKKLHK